MNRRLAGIIAGLVIQAAGALAQSDVVEVQVQGQGDSRDSAVENALERALPQALGTAFFSVTSESGGDINSVSTSVSRGTVTDYEVVSESEIFDGYQVTVKATVSGDAMRESAPVEVTSWKDQLNHVHQTNRAQRQLREQQRVLERYLGGYGDILERGYAFVLRSYVIDRVSEDSVSGRAYVDIHVNRSWWNGFYDMTESITPVNDGRSPQVGPFTGPESVSSNVGGRIDQTLSETVQTPLPVTVDVEGLGHNTFFLSANTISVGGYMMYSGDGEFQADQRLSREYVRGDENSPTPTTLIDRDLSDVSWIARDGDLAGGNRFTVVLDFEKEDESEVIEAMSDGLEYYVDFQSISSRSYD